LKIYGFFKQATIGPCNIPRPSFWDIVNKAKWDAWSCLGDIGKEEAMKLYVVEISKFVEMMPQSPQVLNFMDKLELVDWIEPRQATEPRIDKVSSSAAKIVNGRPNNSHGVLQNLSVSIDKVINDEIPQYDPEVSIVTSKVSICSTESESFATPTDDLTAVESDSDVSPRKTPQQELIANVSLVASAPKTSYPMHKDDLNGHGLISEPVVRPKVPSVSTLTAGNEHQLKLSDLGDNLKGLTDTSDIPPILQSKTKLDNHSRQLSSTGSQTHHFQDDSSSDSSHSSWTHRDSRQRNYIDWPIRSGDDLKASDENKSRKHRRGRDSTVTIGVTRSSLLATASQGGARGRAVTNGHHGRVGFEHGVGGGDGPQSVTSAVNEQIAVALLRIQQDVATLNTRVSTMESLFWNWRNENGSEVPTCKRLLNDAQSTSASVVAKTVFNWLFPNFTMRSIIFLLLWPVLAKGFGMVVKALFTLALIRRKNFNGFEEYPPL